MKLNKVLCLTVMLVLGVLIIIYISQNTTEHFAITDLKSGSKINLKTIDGGFLSVCKPEKCGKCCLKHVCITSEKTTDSIFEVFVHSPGVISLKGINSDWLMVCKNCCKDKCENIICADSGNSNATFSKFDIIENKGKILLKNKDIYIQMCTECGTECKLLCSKKLESLDKDNLGLEITII
jgi:hypothetical protein